MFILTSFWDFLYLFVLIAVAAIWAPGPEAFRYAYYSQAVGTESDMGQATAGGDESDGGGETGEMPHPDDFVIEEEGEAELGSNSDAPTAKFAETVPSASAGASQAQPSTVRDEKLPVVHSDV